MRVGIAGTGRIAPMHVEAARVVGAEVVAIGGSDPARTRALADQHGIPHAMDTEWLTAAADIDVVHVAGRNVDNVATAHAVLDAGKHLVMEKPIGLRAPDAARLVAHAAEAGVHAMTCFSYLGFAGVREARRIVREHSGGVSDVRVRYLQDWMAFEQAPDWRVDPAIAGPGGALSDIGTHVFSLIEFLTDTPMTAVACAVPEGAGFEDAHERPPLIASMLVRLANGALGTIVLSQRALGHDNDLHVEVDGDGRSVVWSAHTPDEVTLVRPGETAAEPERIEAGPTMNRLAVLVGALYRAAAGEGDADDYPTLAFGARSTAFVDACLRSARDGGWVELPAS